MKTLLYALLALTIAGWAWSEWRRRRLGAELRRTMQLFEVSLDMNSTIHKKDLLQRIMDTSARIMQAEASSIILVDPDKGELYFELATGSKGEEVREVRLKMGEGVAGWVAANGKPVKIDDAAGDPRWSSKVANRVNYATRNMLCVPVYSKGAVIGVLQVINKKGGKPFADRDLRLLESIASPTAVSLDNAMLYDALQQSMEALKTTRAAKERMESELMLAQRIQSGFVPKELLPVKSAAFLWQESEAAGVDAGSSERVGEVRSQEPSYPAEVNATLRPAREVGGDFYDYFLLGENELFFALGDVSDKGIPAALYMAMIVTLIKGRMSRGVSPGELLTAVNRELYKDDSTMFATIFCGVLDMRSGKLTFSDGGHCTPYVLREGGGIDPLAAQKCLPLGVMDDTLYANNTEVLLPGDRLVLYSDGITEAEDAEKRQYGTSRLLAALEGMRDYASKQMVGLLLDEVDRFANGAMQSDDIAVLLIEKK